MRGTRAAQGIAVFVSVLAAVASSSGIARAGDAKTVLELPDGTKIEGKLLIVTRKHVVVDAPGRPRFVDRTASLRATEDGLRVDLSERETDSARGALGIVVKKLNDILVHRGDETIKLDTIAGPKGLANALVRGGDELITGASGNVTLVIPGDAQLFARLDADVIFSESGPVLREGIARVEGGDVVIAIPEGKVHARDAILEAEHVKDRTQIRCVGGTCEVTGKDWKLVLHRNDVVDVANALGERPPYISANHTNTGPVWIELSNGKRIRLDHGEKAYLTGITVSDDRPRDDRPRDDRPRDDRPQEVRHRPDPLPDTGLGTITRADADLQLTRSGQRYTVATKDAANYKLKKGDEVATEEGTATLAFTDQTELELGTHTTLVLYPEDAPLPFRLARGFLRASPSGRLGISVPMGEVAVKDGQATVRLSPASITVSVPPESKGRAGLLVKPEVRADVRSGGTLVATSVQGEVKVESLPGSAAADVTCTRVDATLRGGRSITQTRMDDGVLAVTVWNDARLELESGAATLAATIVEETGDLFAYMTDGRRFKLEPGKVVRVGEKKLELAPDKKWPDPKPEPKLEQPRPEEPVVTKVEPPKKPARDVQTVKLDNGAEITLVNWGKLEAGRPDAQSFVDVVGPGKSPLYFGANTKGTLSRARGTASVTTGDKRRLTWNEGPTTLGFDWRLAGDGKLTVTIAKDRTLTVDPATDFEIELRDNGSVPATVVQNTVFVRAGDDVLVRNNGFKIVNKQIDLAKQAGGEGK